MTRFYYSDATGNDIIARYLCVTEAEIWFFAKSPVKRCELSKNPVSLADKMVKIARMPPVNYHNKNSL
ncbi:hypothetical protein [Microcoleus sp. B4-D4]|uniref:hypothetical protein n=1 Tax=Microcoleus sp. B4-D4 TaxID=2818667 RepID=UPI002FCEF9F2